MRRFAFILALFAACSQEQIPTPERSLNRPTDVAVACVKGSPPLPGQQGNRNAQPPQYCNQNTNTTLPIRTLAFIPNSSTGEVAVAALAEGNSGLAQLLDLDSREPGYNFIPVGRLPVAAQTTSDGCRVVVVNQGSCNLSSIDVALVANGADIKTSLPGSVFPVQPHTIAGNILAKPRSIELVPRTDVGARDIPGEQINACDPAFPYHAFVTYPACDLVAEIDVASGVYVRGVFLHADGSVTDAGPAPNCPIECADEGQEQNGPPPTNEVRPVALALDAFDPNPPCVDFKLGLTKCPPTSNPMTGTFTPYQIKSLYVGGATSRFVYKLDVSKPNLATGAASRELDSCPSQPTPSTPVVLSCDPMGVMRLRVSPHQNLITSTMPMPLVAYLYAITLDGTVRVISLDEFRECETAVDAQMVATRFPPLSLANPYSGAPNPNCLPLDEERVPLSLPPIRRSTAVGPGIRVSGSAIDIGFASDGGDLNSNDPLLLAGTFSYVLGSNGTVTVVNLDPVLDITNNARYVSHQVHNRNSEVPGMGPVNGDPSSGSPIVNPATLRFALPLNVGIDETNVQVPTLANIARQCQGALTTQIAVHFPDPAGPHFENWSFIYESGLPDLLRAGGKLGTDTPTTMSLLDPGGRFCARGAMAGDFIEFAGCNNDTECPAGEACFGAIGSQSGLCLAAQTNSHGGSTAPAACLDLVSTRHEFRVISTYNNTLILDEKPLSIPMAAGCTTDDDCANIDMFGAPGADLKHLFSNSHFICDKQPWPGSTVRQCVLQCSPPCGTPDCVANPGDWKPADKDCQPDATFGANPLTSGLYAEYSGYVCGHDPIDPTLPEGPRRCVASRVPRDPTYDIDPRVGRNTADDCFVVPIAYQVHAGLAFLIEGDRTGYLHNITTAGDGSCVVDPAKGPKRIGRLSYNAPRCLFPQDFDAANPMNAYESGVDIGMAGAPHCVWNATKPLPTPNPCLRFVDAGGGHHLLVWQMENPDFEAAIGPVARLGDMDHIGPPTFGNTYGFSFTVQGGFLPLIGLTNAFLPSVIHSGPMFPGPPTGSMWLYVIDSGDQISPTLGTLLQGQMVRFDGISLSLDPHTAVQ